MCDGDASRSKMRKNTHEEPSNENGPVKIKEIKGERRKGTGQ